MDTDIQDPEGTINNSGRTIKTIADDDSPVAKEELDFSVKAQVVGAEERVEHRDQGWETPAVKRTVRMKRTEGGRVFRTEAKSGGMATLRIVAI
jgi:hypothetical protein